MKHVTLFDQSSHRTEGSVALGMAIGAGLNLLQAGLVVLISDNLGGTGDAGLGRSLTILLIGLGGAGIIQLIYIVPLYFYFKKKEKTETAKGLAIAASLVILISAICWGGFGLGK